MRVTAEVDPDLEMTEIVDRTVKAGGPALLFENPKGASHPLLINQFGTERRMCLAFGVERLDDVGRKVSDVLEMQPPSGLMDKVRGLQKLKSIADSRPQTVRRGPVHDIVLQGDDIDLGAPAGAALLARRPGAVRHAARRDHARPAERHAQRRHVPDAGDRPPHDVHALADPQGRPRRLARDRRSHPGRRRARPRPDHRVLRERAAAEAHRRVHAGGLPARLAGRAREGRDRRPRGAGARGDRARGLHREGRARRGRPVRRSHGLLHGGRAVPDLPPHRDDDAQRRDLSVDRRRQAAAGGRVARQGDRAHLPARDPRDGAGDRRLRPAGRRRVPQLLHRLDREGVPRATRTRSCTRSGASGCSR